MASDLLFALNLNISKMRFYNPYQVNKTLHHIKSLLDFTIGNTGVIAFLKNIFINDAVHTVYVLLIAHKYNQNI